MSAFQDQCLGNAAATVQSVVDACADCDTCRYLMDESCLLFPKLYQLWDHAHETGQPIKEDALLALANFCTLCGLCPCPNIRSDVIKAKAAHVDKAGMSLGVRALADIQRFARLGGLAPGLINRLLATAPVSRAVKSLLDIHPQRHLPRIAPESFFTWARERGLTRRPRAVRKAAYFAGCTAGYLFPEVAKAAVGVLSHNAVTVHVPDQQCCGMPTLLEGDRSTTLRRARTNLKALIELGREGYDLVCSCPTCGYLLKVLLKENACYADAYQKAVGAGANEIKVPDDTAGGDGFIRVKKTMYQRILQDNGLFSELDPLERIEVSTHIQDLGAFLFGLHKEGRLNTEFGQLEGHMVYYAPCHQREQGVGSPYPELLAKIPGLDIQPIGGAMDCCGMGGSLGYKRQFHEDSIRLGDRLMAKIEAAAPTLIVTDCLSCRLQFQHRLPYRVLHPLELLLQAYNAGKAA
jgi:glycerol-3-phosphate dehydrogenase subunit C